MFINKEGARKGLGLVLVGAAVCAAGSANAQGLGNSPYSRVGLGEFNANTGGVRQMAMGGAGIAAANGINVNELNPALLYYTSRTTFEAGFNGQYKTVKNATSSGRSGSGTLGYLAMSVPLGTRWGAAAGLKPLSSVDYESNIIQSVVGDPTAQVYKQYRGTGGISEAYLGQGLRIAKNLSLGFTASYLFGVVDGTTATTLQTANSAEATERAVDRVHTRYSDFAFRAGGHYRQKIGKSLNVSVGGVYSFAHNMRGRVLATKERENGNGTLVGPPTVDRDTEGSTYVPALTQVGISFDNNKNWSINIDAAQQEWSKYSNFVSSDYVLHDTKRLGLGGEFTPDPASVEHYFKRVSYRAGLSLAQLPYQPNGKVLYDRSVTWGFAFPLPTATPLDATTISLAFVYGVRGNTDLLTAGVSNVQENYIRGQLGVTLNNRWFIKRRLQ